jgi:hypothetical protein
MTPKLRTLIAMAFAVAGIALALISKVQASSASDKAELTALMQRLLAAYSHKDVSAIMAFYSDDQDAIFFEDTVPCLQRYKTEPVYRRKNEPPLAGCFLSLC